MATPSSSKTAPTLAQRRIGPVSTDMRARRGIAFQDPDPFGTRNGWDTVPHTFAGRRLDEDLLGMLPISEIFSRTRWGRELDMDVIEWAIRSSQIGIMNPVADLLRESLQNAPNIATMVYRRVEQVAGASWELLPAENTGEDEKAKQVCDLTRRWMFKRAEELEQLLADLMWGEIDGRSAAQIDWQRVVGDDVAWAPDGYTWIHPGRLSFGPQRELRVVERYKQTGLYYAMGPALEENPDKFIIHMPRLFNDYPEREGCGLRVLYHLFFDRFAWRERMELIELFAKGWRIVTADGSIESYVSPQAVDKGRDEAEKLGGETNTASFAPGVNFKIEWPHWESGRSLEKVNEDVESILAKLILGQDKTTTGDTYGKGGETMADEQDIIKRGGGRRLSRTVTRRLCEPFVRLNVSPDAVHLTPTFRLLTDPPKDAAAEQERLDRAIVKGVRVPLVQYQEAAGIRSPKAGEPYIMLSTDGVTARVVGPGEPEPPEGVEPPAPPMPPGGLKGPPKGGAGAKSPGGQRLAGKTGNASKVAASLGGAEDGVEHVVERGVREGGKALGAWAHKMAAACKGIDDPARLHRALSEAAEDLDVDDLVPALDRQIVRGMMLGALDAFEDGAGAAIMAELPAFVEVADTSQAFALVGGVVGFVTKPFKEALSFFLGKKVLPRAQFDRLRGSAKRHAFTVAGLARQTMLTTAHEELGKAIKDGADLRTFSKALGDRFESAGWTPLKPSHTEVVFRNAVMGSYSSGRMTQMRQPEVLAARPLWMVRGVDDSRTRPSHRRAHGKVIAATDGVWSSKPPPWGHNCRCRLVSLSHADANRMGVAVSTGAALHELPDDGWDTSSLLG